jgi:hypothetical protein
MRAPSLLPLRNGTWNFLRPFFVLIAVPVISVSLVSSLGSGSDWLFSYGQPALLAYFLTTLTVMLHGSLQHLFRVLRAICIIRRCCRDRDLLSLIANDRFFANLW